jgi:hypothetical protein
MNTPGFFADHALTTAETAVYREHTRDDVSGHVVPQMMCQRISDSMKYCCWQNRWSGDVNCGLVNG